MRVFWYQGGLHVHPEDEHEGRLLSELFELVKFEKPPEMNGCSNEGSSSSCEELLNLVSAEHGIPPRGYTIKASDKNTVVPIHKLR